MTRKKILKVVFLIFVGTIFLYLAVFYFPVLFISQEGDKCLVDSNCLRIEAICEEINEDMLPNSLGRKEPMCINYECRCEWYGNLLHFGK